ncbi:MAG TPA: hypothetical protein VGM82_21465 [Gemmatimonadaceae bacterium]
MSTTARPRRGVDWEAAGAALGETLDAYYALVVIGVDPVATGRVAVAIGRVQAMKRRVAVGDLFAESPPIQELVQTDDPHGIVDSFLYGVSLSRIAYAVPDSGQLFVMPSGTEPPDYDEILPNPRWHRLTAGFREVGALLVLAAPASAPHIEDLVAATDGAILIGDGVPSNLPVVRVISSVRETPPKGVEANAPAVETPDPQTVVVPQRAWGIRRVSTIAGLGLTFVIMMAIAWLAARPFARDANHVRRAADTSKGAQNAAIRPDTAVVASGEAPAVIPLTMSTVQNPTDSAQAAAYAVELIATNTQAGAILKLQQDGKDLPAATFATVLDAQGSPWFKVIGGATIERAGADSLLAELRKRKVLEPTGGSVVRLPFAFLIDSGLSPTAASEMISINRDHGIPAYALKQQNGTSWLLVGAFASVDQSQLYVETLRASNSHPTLVYRKGRTF